MIVVADGTGVTGSTTSGVAEEEAVETCSSLGVPPDYWCSCSADQNHSYTILFLSTIGRKQAELACINYGYHYMHVIFVHVMLDPIIYALPGNGARNACWHFLVQSPIEEVLCPSPATTLEMSVSIS
jgi:hypothetical protein